jgi:hypothetical protein
MPRQAAFFIQQAAEKIGKAMLVRDGIDPARITPSASLLPSCAMIIP